MGDYLFLKTVHILAVIVFVGNIIFSAWWKVMAVRTKEPRIIAFAQRQIRLTDRLFTAPGVTLIFVTGIANVLLNLYQLYHAPWVLWGFSLLCTSSLIWITILLPVQRRQEHLARLHENDAGLPERFYRLERVWVIAGSVATLCPLVAVVAMVYKWS